jgi:hypothetical protein
MAPITTTTVGIARQIIDDNDLISLLERIHALNAPECYLNGDLSSSGDVSMAIDGEGDGSSNKKRMEEMIDGLVRELEDHLRWRFQEQVSCFSFLL